MRAIRSFVVESLRLAGGKWAFLLQMVSASHLDLSIFIPHHSLTTSILFKCACSVASASEVKIVSSANSTSSGSVRRGPL